MKRLSLILAAAVALAGGLVVAQERRVELKDAPGRAQVETHCALCHSLDYVLINSPFLDRNGWDATVTKMIKVFGASISADDAKVIVDYLASNYGKP